MPARILKVDDLRDLTSPDKVVKIFEQLGYNATTEPIDVEDLQLSARSEEEKKAISELVEKCLAVKGVGVEDWEAEIDDRVAQLYGLNPTEINLIKET